MNSFEFYSPTKVFFGKGGVEKVGAAIKEFGGGKVFIHYGSDRILKDGLMSKVKASLDAVGLSYVLMGGVVPNPRLSLVREGVKLALAEKVDFILAVGGGSPIDSAKAIALAAANNCDAWDILTGKVKPTASLSTGNILTIAAAGSETSNSTVLTNEDGGIKIGYGNNLARPKFTIMDPEMLYSLPSYQTAAGIVDIMMHTMDRYFSPGGYNEMTDCIAEQVLRVTIKYGKICMDKPEDYQARSEVMWAGSLSHNDLTGLGRPGDFSPHRLQHELGGKFDVTHGAGLAAVWGAWARYVYKDDVMRFARFGVNVWDAPMDFINPENTARKAIRRTENFFTAIGMPITITQLLGKEITDEDIADMADKAANVNPSGTIGRLKVLGRDDIAEIYRQAR